MPHADNSVTINKPVSDVFAFILDGEKNPLWRPAVADIQRVSGTPDGTGARFKQGLKGPGGRRMDGDYEIVEFQRDKLIKFQVIAGPARPTGSFRFEPVGDTTRVTFSLDYQPRGLAWLMSPMIARTMQGEVATLANLKAYLEKQQA